MRKRFCFLCLISLLGMKTFSENLQNKPSGGGVFLNANIGGAFGFVGSEDFDWASISGEDLYGNGFVKGELAAYYGLSNWISDSSKFLGFNMVAVSLFVDANFINYFEFGASASISGVEVGWSYSGLKGSKTYLLYKPRLFFDTSDNKFSINLFPFLGFTDIDLEKVETVNLLVGMEVGISFNSRNRRIRQSKAAAERNAERAREYILKLEEEEEKRKAAAEERRKAMEEEKASDYEAVSKLNSVLAWRSFNGKWGISGKSPEIDNILLNQYEIDSILDLNIGHNTNPYGLRKDVLYYTYGISVVQWLSPESFLADIDSSVSILGQGKVKIHIRNCYAFNAENIENLSVVNDSCYHVYLRYNGAFSYNSAQAYETVPSFDIVLFY